MKLILKSIWHDHDFKDFFYPTSYHIWFATYSHVQYFYIYATLFLSGPKKYLDIYFLVCLSLYILFCCIVLHNHHLSIFFLNVNFDLWKKNFCTYSRCVFPMKDFDLTYTLTVNCSSRLFSVFFLFSVEYEEAVKDRQRCFWNLTIAVQNSAFWMRWWIDLLRHQLKLALH